MITTDPKLLDPFFFKHTKESKDFSTPVPASFLQSLSVALLIDGRGFPLTMPIAFLSPYLFGRSLNAARVPSSAAIAPLQLLRHSGQATYVNIRFLKSAEGETFDVYSDLFKTKFLRTLGSEWRLIAQSFKIRTVRSEGYRNIARAVYEHFDGSYPAIPTSIDDLLNYAEQLRDLLEQAKLDIRQLDMRSSHPLIARERQVLLTTTCWDSIDPALPVLHKICDTISKFKNVPVLSKAELFALAKIIETAPIIAKSLPLHQALLRCLYPYIASLVDAKIILPVCPMVLDVFNNRLNKKSVNSLYELGKAKKATNEQEQANETSQNPPLAESQTSSVSLSESEADGESPKPTS